MIGNTVVEITNANAEKHMRELLDSSYQRVKRLFVLAYDNTVGNNQISVDSIKKYFLPRIKIEIDNIEIGGRNFYDQPINDSVKQYDKVRKVSIGQGNWWLYNWSFVGLCLFWKKNYRLNAADLSKQKALDADSRAIQQVIFTGKITAAVASTRVIIYYILEQSKETNLRSLKEQQKICY